MKYSRIGMLSSFLIFTVNMLMPVDLVAESDNSGTSTPIENINTDLSEDKTSKVEPPNEALSEPNASNQNLLKKDISKPELASPELSKPELSQELSDEEISDDDEICEDELIEPDNTDKPFFSFLDGTHDTISSSIESLAKNMDDFFTVNNNYYESSGSYLRLKQNVIFSEGGIITYKTEASFKLRLPNTEKKFKLFFDTPSVKTPYDNSTQTAKETVTGVTEGNYVLGILAESGEKFGWKYKPTLGIDIDNKIDPFAKFRFSRESKFGKWDYKWHETPYWYNSIGWGFDNYFELNRNISAVNLFRSSTFAGWREDTQYFDLSHVFSMFHVYSDKKAMSYFAGVYGTSEPEINTTHFLIGLTYRQNIHKDYLFMEIVPQVIYQKINRFYPEHTITFRLEMLFKK